MRPGTARQRRLEHEHRGPLPHPGRRVAPSRATATNARDTVETIFLPQAARRSPGISLWIRPPICRYSRTRSTFTAARLFVVQIQSGDMVHVAPDPRRILPVDAAPVSRLQYKNQEALILDRENDPVPIYPEPVDGSPGKPGRFPDVPVGVRPEPGRSSRPWRFDQ